MIGEAAIRGVVGLVKWSYYTAARLEGYTVRRSQTGQWSLQATIVLADAFKITQRPLVFVAPHDKGEWRWPIESVERDGPHLRAVLGPPQEETYAQPIRST